MVDNENSSDFNSNIEIIKRLNRLIDESDEASRNDDLQEQMNCAILYYKTIDCILTTDERKILNIGHGLN